MAARSNRNRPDDDNEVIIPSYEDRTLAVEHTVVVGLLRRWLPILLIAAFVIVGPFAGGWWYAKSASESDTAALMGALQTEFDANVAALGAQASIAEAVALGGVSRTDELSPAFRTSRWTMVAPRLDVALSSDSAARLADFYDGLNALSADYRRVHAATERWRWALIAAPESADAAKATAMAAASRLREALRAQETAARNALDAAISR